MLTQIKGLHHVTAMARSAPENNAFWTRTLGLRRVKVAGDDGKGRWRAVFPTQIEESDEQALGDESVYSRLQRVD